jgi:prepilin-type N-terminal cleavage/methylation domain-containing protein
MKHSHGFSLVELSIVLVILGLLVGGILAGQSLIRASELRSVSSDFQRYNTAIHAFRDRYFAYPGDMNNATQFWGIDTDGCPNNTTRTPKTVTCNGSGDRLIGQSEYFRAWQHLANAGLIEGGYSGVAGSLSTRHAVIGQNVPAGRIANTGYSFYYQAFTGHAERFDASSGQVMEFGGPTDSNGGFETYGRVLKPEEAWNIDSKTDDGRPGLGKVFAWKLCSTSTDPLLANYNLASSARDCHMQFAILR